MKHISWPTVLLLLPVLSGIYLLKSFRSDEAFHTAVTFGILWAMSVAVIGYYKFSKSIPIKFEEDLSLSDLGYVGLGYILVLATSFFFSSDVFKGLSLLFVPTGAQIASFNTQTSDIIYNASLVVPAEELLVLAAALALMLVIPGVKDKPLAFFGARLAWSLMHFYLAGYTWPFALGALTSGMIMSAMMIKTNSILAPYLIHLGYNSTIIILTPNGA